MPAYAYSYKIEESRFVLHIDCEEAIPWNNTFCNYLISNAMLLDDVVPMDNIKLDTSDNITYDYKLKAADGREFKQTIIFDSPVDTNPGMTFNISVPWEEREFAPHRIIRSIIIELIVQFKLRKLNMTWN